MKITAHKIERPEDQAAAFKIREEVFVQEQKVPADAEYDAHEPTASHYLAKADNQPVGAARWRQTENGIKLERFAVLAPYRSQQVGSILLNVIMEDLLATQQGKKIYLHAQLRAVPFYERHGFVKSGPMFTECDIQHYKMEWNG
ncbi:GNAT family N-acetyltransferase [Rufibacter soli]